MKNKRSLIIAIILTFVFVIYTILVKTVDVQPIGPNNSSVGLSFINQKFHQLVGVNFTLYNITDWGGIIPIIIGIIYGIVGLIQLIQRKNILKVDSNILALGCFYIATLLVYLFFEFVVINHRPVLINGYLEASYPSSTTMLAICFLTTSIYQTKKYFTNKTIKEILVSLQFIFLIFLVVGRAISGVHWLTDIIGGILASIALIEYYHLLENCFSHLKKERKIAG